MIRMSETTRTHTPGKQLDCDILISSLMKHVLTNRPMFHSDSEKLRRKIWATKSSSSDQTWHIEKPKKFDVVCDMMFICPLLAFSIHVIGSIIITPLFNWKKKVIAPKGVRAIGAGGLQHPPPSPPAPPNFEQLRFLGATRKIWADQILTKVSMFRFVFFFFERVIFFILSLSRRGKAS